MKDQKKLIDVLEKYTVEPYKKYMVNELQPSIRLKTTGNACKQLGKTKLGGSPDLSLGQIWPTSKIDNQHLSFLGQINLEEVKEFDEKGLLPLKGMLYFFFNLDSGDDGEVIFLKNVSVLEKAVPPEEFKKIKKSFLSRMFTGKSQKRILRENGVEIYKEYSFPSWDSLRLERIQKETGTDIKPINAFEEGFFEDSYDAGETGTTSNHHLVGNYKGIQNEFHELNLIDFEIEDYEDLTIDEIGKALKWKLLFQFDSDDNLEISFGDWGRIYFFIHENDLANFNFENVRISTDCY